MRTVQKIDEMHAQIKTWRNSGKQIAFIPTMGNLHEGHLSLIKQAHQRADHVVVSIFVNPMQFGQDEDLDNYPRTLQDDSRKLFEIGVDLLFTPTVSDLYPQEVEASTRVEVPGYSDILCGAHRPNHFIGVTTIVTKLFNIVQPDIALFGKKDYQQLLIIRRATEDLCIPVTILGVPTVREDDGLAMSSRNGYLSADERQSAPTLYKTLKQIRQDIQTKKHNYTTLERHALSILKKANFTPDYFSIRRADNLAPAQPKDNNLIILAAARLGKTRLIDNINVTITST